MNVSFLLGIWILISLTFGRKTELFWHFPGPACTSCVESGHESRLEEQLQLEVTSYTDDAQRMLAHGTGTFKI